MLTRWLTFTAFLAGSANPERAAIGRAGLTVAPTCRVKGHPEGELTLNCGDGKNTGVVQYWHTPFGELQTPGVHSELDPVFMHHDGSLVVPNTSTLHSGLYYCLLQHTEGKTLWPYELHVGHNSHKNQDYEQCDAFRFRRDVGSVDEGQAGVSDGQFAGAVAASVLLTFVLGFSAGALTRTHVLRCLGAVTTRLRSPRQQRYQTDTQEVTMTTMPPMYDNQAFEIDQMTDDEDDAANCATMDTSISSTTSCPPVKPQRSFRQRPQEEQETTAYLEGCDYTKEEERRMEEKEEEEEEENKGCDGEAQEGEREFSGFYLLEEDREDEDGRGSREEKREWSQEEEEVEEENRSKEEEEVEEANRSKEEEEEEEAAEQENRSKEDGGSEEEVAGGNEEKGRDDGREGELDDGEQRREEDGEMSSEDDETGSNKQEDTKKTDIGGEPSSSSSSSPGRRRRVIRLYQYDEDGQRYGHLPDPAAEDPGPAPKLKHRSLSLTRLSAIMAAASAGPLDTRETGKEEKEERPHFHMEI